MASSTAAPLPNLPESPLGDLPANPLGAPPTPPLVGKRAPLRFPDLRSRNGGGGRSTRAPLPNLDVLNQRRRAAQQAKKAQQAQQTPTPAAPATRPASQAQPTAPIVLRPQVAPAASDARGSATRRTARQARDEQLAQIHALFGPQLAEHPAFARADSRHQGLRSAAAHLRGYAAAYHQAGMAAGRAHTQAAQRANPGYSPREPDAEPAPEPGMPPEVRARRERQYQDIRGTLDALRRKPSPPAEGQP